jgi:hypothetical protein
MLVTPSAEETSSSFLVDCRKLPYCAAGSTAVVRAEPGSPYDGVALSSLADVNGFLQMPKRIAENSRFLQFYPGSASAGPTNLNGDMFGLMRTDGGVVTFSEFHVVTSSVVTPPAWKSFAGTDTEPLVRMGDDFAKSVADPSSVSVSFYRPQAFKPGTAWQLMDRGGLAYGVRIWPSDQSNISYPCPACCGRTGEGATGDPCGLLNLRLEPGPISKRCRARVHS